MKQKSAILQVAATYIGTVIGAGFATGKEIVEFFIIYGPAGLLGILISGLLFIWIGTKIMLLSHQRGFHSYKQFNEFLFGKKLGSIADLVFLVMLIGSTSVMVAGTGSIFQEQLGMPAQWGILLIIVLSFFAMLRGLTGIFAVNTFVVPMMVFFSLLIAVFTLAADPAQSILNVISYPAKFNSGWLFSGLTYVSFNLAMSQAVLIPLGKEVDDENTLKWGGVWGGIGLTLLLMTSYFTLFQLPDVAHFDIPTAQLAKAFGALIYALYVTVIFGEIFTTVIGNIFGLTRYIVGWIRIPESAVVFCILLICAGISQIEFSILLSFLYRGIGFMGFLMLFYLIIPGLPRLK